jgi:excisionase family DNA binding protein
VKASDRSEQPASSEPPSPSPSPEICRPAELARYLGLSTRSVYEYIRRKELPGVRMLGRSVLIHLPTVIAWVADGQGGGPRSRRSKS